MTGYVSVAWQRQLRVVPAVGCCGGRHRSAAELVKPRELVATYRPGGAAAYVPVCEACDRAIFAGELEWAQVTGAEPAPDEYLAARSELLDRVRAELKV